VFFRRKEITIYPDDENKPPMGEGLNKRAQVTLDAVWPMDKTTRLPIKSPTQLRELAYQDRLERASAKIGAKFCDYLPETGSWVFEVSLGSFSRLSVSGLYTACPG
jgi:nuclear pore complex protein Nup98-Nup96